MKKLSIVTFCLNCNALFEGNGYSCPECKSGAMVIMAASEVARIYKLVDEQTCPNFTVNSDGDGYCEILEGKIGEDMARA